MSALVRRNRYWHIPYRWQKSGENGSFHRSHPTTKRGRYIVLGTAVWAAPWRTAVDESLRSLSFLDKLGGPESEPHYPVGWAWAGNTPFQWVKQVASHLGGTRNSMVVTRPAKIKHDDKPRDAFLHLVDVVPTILEATHVPMPKTVNGIEQKALAGKSFIPSYPDPEFEGRPEQYFEIFTNRSIYHDGWKANAQHTLPWRQGLAPGNGDKDKWELYNLDNDFSEADNLAAEMPDKLTAMRAKFDSDWSPAQAVTSSGSSPETESNPAGRSGRSPVLMMKTTDVRD